MRRKDRRSVDSGTQAGIQVAVGDLVSIFQALSTVNTFKMPSTDACVLHPKLGANPTI
jgi:hypothetical protein